ncbi:MAG: glutathione S-transferase family protein [Gammaproteobacteria bacterium]|nr:glutathione S-transferase family protein [Gammaproteobacteria bacterium]
MSRTDPIALRGAPGSPYTRKMLAVLRFRRIPYRFLVGLWARDDGLPRPKVDLLPTFYFDSDEGVEAVVDSTPIIRRLENEYLGRSVIPDDPALAFIDYLVEDYADEWLTKAMFHYRWQYEADVALAGEILPRWRDLTASASEIAPRADAVRERQIGRLYVVGSNEVTASVIEESYRRFLGLLDDHIGNGPFLFGGRPSAADFGLFGQLTQLATFDPTPRNLTAEIAPRVLAWVQSVEDLSGLEPHEEDWVERGEAPETLRALLVEVGRTYVPVMLANAHAIDARADQVAAEVDGEPWTQRPFPYQAKCLQWVRQEYARLDGTDRGYVDNILAGTGCEALF